PPAGHVVIHREAIEAGRLGADRVVDVHADLAPDQRAAVGHAVGPARIIAPAGSGKTRVLTERLRHLLAGRGVDAGTVTAVAYNTRAADELRGRTTDLPAQIRTLNSLGLAIVTGSGGLGPTAARPRRVIEEIDVRRILEGLVTVRRQQNTDPWVPYLEALSAIRLGLASPDDVEQQIPDAAGIADAFDRYRRLLADRDLLDFDEQIYGAIEVLLRDPEARRRTQVRCRHLLVDEFQDLTPAHLLLLRLVSAPTYDVFGVGDDDQVIYSYAGATPEFLIGYDRYFPGAGSYALEVNYRCPPAVVDGARHLLSYNRRRIDKTITAAPGRAVHPGDLVVERVPGEEQAAAVVRRVRAWADAGSAWEDMAVLARVNAALLPAQVTLGSAGIPHSAPLGPQILTRTGIRAALAYLRIGLDPERIARADLVETLRRPSRKIARNVADMIQKRRTTSIGDLRRLAGALTGGDASKVEAYADDLRRVASAVHDGDTASALRVIRNEVGLGQAMDALDASRREADRSTHADDLAALEQVAALHPDAATFEPWLRDALTGRASPGGVTLSTVHRVKGREWPRVIVIAADDGTFPHRLATDVEEERRIFHVAITRSISETVVIADARTPSPFCAELTGTAPRTPPPAQRARDTGTTGREKAAAARAPRGGSGTPASIALRAWRKETAARDKVPAYVVFSDDHLEGIAAALPRSLDQLARCRGVGPAKLERYGDEVLAVIESVVTDEP
ncbi:MAG TPA: ATP-dependent DNA helicase UvrD2, partial [Acidimicrobiales bacterium]|nr:ATP-dependent DNA helicase UvrD2 [Acidimicrobiales bacterium]